MTGFTLSGTGCFIAVPMWQKWASKGFLDLLVENQCCDQGSEADSELPGWSRQRLIEQIQLLSPRQHIISKCL